MIVHGQSQEQVMRYMNASNVLLLPSLAEGSPNVVKEAMACNLPVVATDVGDVAQVIGHTAGCSVCAPDADELAAALATALLHTGPTTGRNAIMHLESSLIAERVLELYRQALARKRSSRARPSGWKSLLRSEKGARR